MTGCGTPKTALARLAFAYEAEHSAGFATALGGFLASNHISSAALADAIMFLGFAMLIVQRGTLAARSYLSVRRPLGADETHAPGAVAAETPS
jgi:hypothetical protein